MTDEIRLKISKELKELQEDLFREFDGLVPDDEVNTGREVLTNKINTMKDDSYRRLNDFKALNKVEDLPVSM